jgi:hypothetical protein
MKPRYGPDETWPGHQKPYWNKALGEARAAGWILTYDDAPHRYGVVSCPGGDDGTSCTFEVDKTAKGGETFSVIARTLIRNCRHGTTVQGSKVRARQDECQRLLDHADRLIGVAAMGLDQIEVRQAALADLDQIQARIEAAEANLDEILKEDMAAALEAVYDSDYAPLPDEISSTLAEAADTADEGASVATTLKVRRPRLAKPFLLRALEAQKRIAELRARLAELML